jgi:hypothetical protein
VKIVINQLTIRTAFSVEKHGTTGVQKGSSNPKIVQYNILVMSVQYPRGQWRMVITKQWDSISWLQRTLNTVTRTLNVRIMDPSRKFITSLVSVPNYIFGYIQEFLFPCSVKFKLWYIQYVWSLIDYDTTAYNKSLSIVSKSLSFQFFSGRYCLYPIWLVCLCWGCVEKVCVLCGQSSWCVEAFSISPQGGWKWKVHCF